MTRPLLERCARPPGHRALADLPTPVERRPELADDLVPAPELWVKRDDQTSRVYGGGKVRKLEWQLARAPWDRGDVTSLGASGSHHLLALALFLRREGRGLHALCCAQPPSDHATANLAVLASCSVQFWPSSTRLGLPLAGLGWALATRPWTGSSAWMPAGGSSPAGMLGFVDAGLELAAQVRAGLLPRPARIYVAVGTAGVAAGLALGLALAGLATELRLVAVVERWLFDARRFASRLAAVHAELGRLGVEGLAPTPAQSLAAAQVRWVIDDSALGPGYANPTAEGRWAVQRAAAAGLALETTYTGKALAALRRDLAAGRHPPQAPVLLWNTHGGDPPLAEITDGWLARVPGRLRPPASFVDELERRRAARAAAEPRG